MRGRPAIPCVVKNISNGGALLEFETAEMLPFRFRIQIESEGIDCDCETRHQDGRFMGVQFTRAEVDNRDEPKASVDEIARWGSTGGANSIVKKFRS